MERKSVDVYRLLYPEADNPSFPISRDFCVGTSDTRFRGKKPTKKISTVRYKLYIVH
jgi:hypothetical protein